MLQPKLFTTLKNYSFQAFTSDLTSGVIVGIVALPLAVAFAIASGVSPDKGLVTAVVAGFLISALGGSKVQIGGPTGAFVVIVYGIVQQHGIDGLIMATFLAGIMLIVLGVAGLGSVIKFIPHPVVVGFTSGIAVIIFSSEAKDFLGLGIESLPADFLHKWAVIIENLGTINLHALLIASGTVLIITLWPRVSRKIPGSLVALILSVLAVKIFQWPVETIGTRFGDLPAHFPTPSLPEFNFDKIQELIQPAMTIALLGAIESLLSAVVSDGMIGGRHRSNMELIAQGIANIGSAAFGGIPATGAIARTVTNVNNGGRTPVAGMIHALTLFLIMMFLGQWAKLIPLACLSGILVVVSYHMSEWRSFLAELRGLRGSAAVLMATFAITIFFDLSVAVQFGMVASLFLFMRRMSRTTKFRLINEEETIEKENENIEKIKVPSGIDVYEITGAFFFGVAHEFEEVMRVVAKKPRVRILKMKHVPMIDSTAIKTLREFHRKCRASRIHLMICGIQPQPLRALKQTDLYKIIGEDNFFDSIERAIECARSMAAEAETK